TRGLVPASFLVSAARSRDLGLQGAMQAAPHFPVLAQLVFVIVHLGPRLERGLRLQVELARRRAVVQPEGREVRLDLPDDVRLQDDDILRVFAGEQGEIVHVENANELLDRGGMVVDADVDPAVVEARVADADLALRRILVAGHEPLHDILRCDATLQHREGVAPVRRVRVRLRRHRSDPGRRERHDRPDRDEFRFDGDAEILRLGIERDDAERGRSRPMHRRGNGRTLFRDFPVPATLKVDSRLRDLAVHVLLDLYGVLLDHEKMFRGYRERLAELLAARFGGTPETWRRAHDEAWVTYVQRVNSVDWESRGYADIGDELDARHLLEIFERVGVTGRPADTLAVSREFEREAMSHVNARYSDARTAIERLRSAGHRVYVATGGSET